MSNSITSVTNECGDLWASVTAERLSIEMNDICNKVCKFLSTKITKDEIAQVRSTFQQCITEGTKNTKNWNSTTVANTTMETTTTKITPAASASVSSSASSSPTKEKSYSESDLKDLTVSQIREILRERRLPTSGRKDDLIKRFLAYQKENDDVEDDEEVDEIDTDDDEDDDADDAEEAEDDDDDDDDDDESSDEDDEE